MIITASPILLGPACVWKAVLTAIKIAETKTLTLKLLQEASPGWKKIVKCQEILIFKNI